MCYTVEKKLESPWSGRLCIVFLSCCKTLFENWFAVRIFFMAPLLMFIDCYLLIYCVFSLLSNKVQMLLADTDIRYSRGDLQVRLQNYSCSLPTLSREKLYYLCHKEN
jgi:hypothetical protein